MSANKKLPAETEPNARQVGGDHYKKNTVDCPNCGVALEHWDIYGQRDGLLYGVTRYLWRWQDKNGVEDLEKARHFIDKMISVASRREAKGKER
jgi:hypothetical protein